LNHVRETLSFPFNSPETIWDCETWLHFIHKLLANIHEGLVNSQTFAASNVIPYDAFDDLLARDVGLIASIKEVLDSLDDFFYSEKDNNTCNRTLCY
jgi:hypothetical protein